jgi:hypothetical protein
VTRSGRDKDKPYPLTDWISQSSWSNPSWAGKPLDLEQRLLTLEFEVNGFFSAVRDMQHQAATTHQSLFKNQPVRIWISLIISVPHTVDSGVLAYINKCAAP